MPLETPLLKVSRPVAACQRCRQAKIKCDGKLPACSACERSNRASECSSTNDQFARGKERSYVATLENKVEKLERKINEARARRKSSLQLLDAALSPRRISVDDTGKPKNPRAARRRELADIDELVSDFGFLTVNATSRDFYGFTSAISYARLILSAAGREPLPEGLRKDLPPRFAAQPLVQHYLSTLHLILPIVEETKLYASLDAVYHQDTTLASNLDHWTIRLVLAIASAMKSNQRGDAMYSDAVGHICSALEVSEQVLHPGSVFSIQAMLLFVLYAMMDPAHFDSWTLIGAASRMMIDLGMHQDPSKSVQMPKPKLELRRRVFWCVYALDRSTSIVQTRAFSFSDDGSNVAMPFPKRGTKSTPSSPQQERSPWLSANNTALDFFKLRSIQSSWYTDLFQSGREAWREPYTYIWQRYEEMRNWFNQLLPTTLPSIRDFFELELLYSYIYLLSPSPRCPHPSEHAQRLIIEHAMTYAEKIHSIVSNPTEAKNPMSFYDAIRVYMTGRHFLDCLAKNMENLLKPSSTTPLSNIGGYSTQDAEVDPMAAVSPPPIPSPSALEPGSIPKDPTTRAIDAVNHFIEVLSYFGTRFGFVGGISYRDRFQRESQQLLSQLYQRRASLQSMDSAFGMWNPSNAPMTPPTHLASPGASASFYPSPASTQYSPAITHVQHDHNAVQPPQAWNTMSHGQDQAFISSTMADMPVGMMASTSLDVLGIPSFVAYETLPGGNLNVRFPR
ncbi:hypothetical protein, variant [Verruconis gallopava]|nr:hypothetical protein, variant [Verruconis gallopava]KIW01830.1 hypothetical protein, variant [Verruconis gallopava]